MRRASGPPSSDSAPTGERTNAISGNLPRATVPLAVVVFGDCVSSVLSMPSLGRGVAKLAAAHSHARLEISRDLSEQPLCRTGESGMRNPDPEEREGGRKRRES